MSCPECRGTGRITLFTSVVDCEACASPRTLPSENAPWYSPPDHDYMCRCAPWIDPDAPFAEDNETKEWEIILGGHSFVLREEDAREYIAAGVPLERVPGPRPIYVVTEHGK